MFWTKSELIFDGGSSNSNSSSPPQMRFLCLAILLWLTSPLAAQKARSLFNQLPPADSNIKIVLPSQAGYANASQPCKFFNLMTCHSDCSG